MKKISSLLLFIITLGVVISADAQITITRATFEQYFMNSHRAQIGSQFDNSASFDVGNPSSSAQAFNFGTLPADIDSLRDTTYTDYVSPTGLPGAASFPDANVAAKQVTYNPPATMTLAIYYQLADNGVFGLGYALHYYIPGFMDTLMVSISSPKSKLFPLPLTLGTQSTSTDSTVSPSGDVIVTTRTFNANGFGTLSLPDGSSQPAIRVQQDYVNMTYSNGTFQSRDVGRSISMWGADLSMTSFDVDTAFTGGNVLVNSFTYEIRTGAAAVHELSREVPDGFALNQNYPNPFNPITTITFKIASEGFTTVKIFDVLGREVATLMSENLSAGSYSVQWDATDVQSGVYFYKLQSGNYSETKKLMLMK